MKKRWIWILTLLPFGVWSQPAFITDSLDTYIEREMQRWQVPGLAIAIVKDGKTVVEKGYGVKQYGKSGNVDAYTLFQIASNSKAFTGTAIAWLDYEKRLKLDEKVTTYLPWFKLHNPDYTHMCTVRDLLCHRIGLQTFQGDFLNWGSDLTRKQIIEGLARTPEVYPFRYTYGYNNAAFITAGELIPAITDTTWDDFITYRFFKPLGMVHTTTSYHEMLKDKNACVPHTLVRNVITTMPLANIDNMGASAAIHSCVADMSKWVMLQLDNGKYKGTQLVPYDVLKETRKSAMVVSDPQSSLFRSRHFITYGLGWRSYDYEGRRIYEHSGGANGFVTKTEFIPEEKLGVIVYTNTDVNSLYEALCKQVIEAYLNLPYRNLSETFYKNGEKGRQQEARDQHVQDSLIQLKHKTPLDIQAYTGTFSNSLYGTVTIRNESGKLKLYFEHHPNNIGTIQHLKDGAFLVTYSDVVCGVEPIVFSVRDNRVNGVKVKVNNFIDYLSYEFMRKE